MTNKYSIIYADPPWQYNDKALRGGGAERHYPTMSDAEICALPIRDIAADDCALFIWGTWPKLDVCLDVMRSWGFALKTCAFVWVKATAKSEVNQSRLFAEDESLKVFWGMGQWTRSNSEYCLLGVRGKPKRQSASVHQVIYSPVLRHSEKPAIVRDKIVELLGDVSRIELFARTATVGWCVFGNQVDGSIVIQ